MKKEYINTNFIYCANPQTMNTLIFTLKIEDNLYFAKKEPSGPCPYLLC